ncbi:hypothetical protein HN588_10580 [Candidatus Bathyarchaeota archaeon]|nr:hypothetical protein [Candidatus Bathyarchaeota archaeon]
MLGPRMVVTSMREAVRRIVNGPTWQRRHTWEWEAGVVGLYLLGITISTTNWADSRIAAGQVASALAVFFTFMHVKVASRLEEAQEKGVENGVAPTVECYKKLTHYLIGKELLWFCAFICLEAWAALAGIPIFLLYPMWRKFYCSLRRNVK